MGSIKYEIFERPLTARESAPLNQMIKYPQYREMGKLCRQKAEFKQKAILECLSLLTRRTDLMCLAQEYKVGLDVRVNKRQ